MLTDTSLRGRPSLVVETLDLLGKMGVDFSASVQPLRFLGPLSVGAYNRGPWITHAVIIADGMPDEVLVVVFHVATALGYGAGAGIDVAVPILLGQLGVFKNLSARPGNSGAFLNGWRDHDV